jgi:hypothetical protein
MTREQLRTASEALRTASDGAADPAIQRRLHDQSTQFATLATADHGPDHGRLARHLNALNEIREDAGEEVSERIDAAEEAIIAYRETVEGV